MKILFFCFINIVLFSCSKEKTPQPINIVGKWKMTESYDNYKNSNGFTYYKIQDENFFNVEVENNNKITFLKNGEIIFTGNYSINEKEIQVFEIENTVLYKFTINNLTQKNLKISYKTTAGIYEHWFTRK